jgi:hypothetical protein
VNLRLSLLTLMALAATALPSPAVELEKVVRSRVDLSVNPATRLPSTGKGERRSLTLKVRSLLSGAAARLQLEVTTFWFGGGAADAPRTVLAINRLFAGSSTGHMNLPNQDSGLQTVKIEGWVVTIRDPQTKELLAVKGSSAELETLARTPGALPAQPGPVQAAP